MMSCGNMSQLVIGALNAFWEPDNFIKTRDNLKEFLKKNDVKVPEKVRWDTTNMSFKCFLSNLSLLMAPLDEETGNEA